MFHSAKLESRQNDQVVFGEGVWYLCIFLLPFECIEHFGCDIGALCYFLRVGLTMVDRNVPSVARIRFPCQLTGNKREKIGAERSLFPGKKSACALATDVESTCSTAPLVTACRKTEPPTTG